MEGETFSIVMEDMNEFEMRGMRDGFTSHGDDGSVHIYLV